MLITTAPFLRGLALAGTILIIGAPTGPGMYAAPSQPTFAMLTAGLNIENDDATQAYSTGTFDKNGDFVLDLRRGVRQLWVTFPSPIAVYDTTVAQPVGPRLAPALFRTRGGGLTAMNPAETSIVRSLTIVWGEAAVQNELEFRPTTLMPPNADKVLVTCTSFAASNGYPCNGWTIEPLNQLLPDQGPVARFSVYKSGRRTHVADYGMKFYLAIQR